MTKMLFYLIICLNLSVAQAQDWVHLSQSNLAALLEKQKSDLVRVDIRSYSTEKLTYLTYGVPKTARPLDARGMIFRHYVGSGMDKILACNCLKAGFTPYIILNPGLGREIFEDLYGIFLTTTTANPQDVGLEARENYDYIDFELNPETGVLWLEPNIFVVPGNGDVVEWLKPKYKTYKETGVCEPMYCDTFKKIDAKGGVHPMFIPVQIKCLKRNNVLTCI